MKSFVGTLCVVLIIQFGVALGEKNDNVPDRFKVVQGLKYHQDAADKVATRTITSTDPQSYWKSDASAPTPIGQKSETQQREEHDENCEDAKVYKTADESREESVEGEATDDENVDAEHPSVDRETTSAPEELATREIGSATLKYNMNGVAENQENEDGNDLKTRGLFESGMNMIPTRLQEAAASIGKTATNMKDTATSMIQDPQGARRTIHQALVNAKERVMGPEMRNNIQNMYQSGIGKGINLYKDLNQRLSPEMARTLNSGVASTIRGINAAKEAPITKKITERVSSFMPSMQ